jgi:hypothetical protein
MAQNLPVLVERKKFYRYSDWSFESDRGLIETRLEEEVLFMVRETPCGWWISEDKTYDWKADRKYRVLQLGSQPHWVSKTSRKKYAYPTRKEALESFLARKMRQISILDFQVQGARNAYKEALMLQQEGKFPKTKRYPWN